MGTRSSPWTGGSPFRFALGISLFVSCSTQGEIDRFWERLSKGGETGRCGWLKDRWGISWQIVPKLLAEMMEDPASGNVARMGKAMLKMGKLDIKALQRAYAAK